mgnify:CR=1 FL=1
MGKEKNKIVKVNILGQDYFIKTSANPPLIIDAGVQWQHLIPRAVQKTDPGDPVGNLDFSGELLVGSVEVRHHF